MTRRKHHWRCSYDSSDGTRINLEDAGDFDELVLGRFIHIERMDRRSWWLRIGDAYVWVSLDRNGTPTAHIQRGEYGPVIGRTEP